MRGELPSAGFGVLFGAPQNVLQALLQARACLVLVDFMSGLVHQPFL